MLCDAEKASKQAYENGVDVELVLNELIRILLRIYLMMVLSLHITWTMSILS